MLTYDDMSLPTYTDRYMKVTSDFAASDKRIPWINLKGVWLEKAGFAIDDRLKVRVINRCLVIVPEE